MFKRIKKMKKKLDASAAKAQAQLDKREAEKKESQKVRCTECFSQNVTFIQNDKKSFSVGKAAAGTMLAGGIGSLAGFTGKKGKDVWKCNRCGSIFSK